MALETPRILIADDEPLFRHAVADALRARLPGCLVTEVGDGVEAEVALLEDIYSCVITDLQMPIIDGYGLLEVLRDRCIEVPIVVVSAHGTESTKARVAELGAARYLDKPVDLSSLVDEVLELIAWPSPPSSRSRDGVLAGQVLRVLEAERPRRSEFPPSAEEAPRRLEGRAPGSRGAIGAPPPRLSLASLSPITNPAPRTAYQPTRTGSFSQPQQFERNLVMNIDQALSSAMEISGCIGVALVDFESGMSLGSKGTGAINLDTAAAGNTEVIRAKLRTMQSLGLEDKIDDVLITLSTQYHILRPLRRLPNLFLYLALDRSKANLALARMKATTIEQELRI
jgi:CheY-like chemotaxis protein